MSIFEEREKALENKFAHDEALLFKAGARRNRHLALWAAAKMGLDDARTDAYVIEVIEADFEEAGHEDVFRKIRRDFDANGVAISDADIRRTMEELLASAIAEVKAEG